MRLCDTPGCFFEWAGNSCSDKACTLHKPTVTATHPRLLRTIGDRRACEGCGYLSCSCDHWVELNERQYGKDGFVRRDKSAAVWETVREGMECWAAGLMTADGHYSAHPSKNAIRHNWMSQPIHKSARDAMQWADRAIKQLIADGRLVIIDGDGYMVAR